MAANDIVAERSCIDSDIVGMRMPMRILFLCIQDMFFSGSMRDVLTRRWTRASDGFIMLGKENIDFRNRTFRMKK